MTTLLKQWRALIVGAAAAIALTALALGAQYARGGWPFAHTAALPPPTAHGGQHPAPETAGEMPGMPGMSQGAHDAHGAHAGQAASAEGPPGYAPITVDPARAGALNLSTVVVEERDFKKKLRTVGVVALDETRSAHVHSKVRGWIDGISVNFVGRRINAGEPLCSIYSQEVYAAEVEFLSILDRAASRTSSPEGPDPLLEAARRRLRLWDVPEAEIARLQSSREARRTFPLLAPRSGIVVSKEAIEGMYVDPSLELYTLSDLSRVWVLADVYELDVPYVHLGDSARLTIEGQGEPLETTVSFISPTIDEATRTLKVRFQLDNRGGRFRPGAFVAVEMDLGLGRGLSIPESAVIRTGARSIVFVAHGEHSEHLQPREVTLGPLVGENYRIDAGLQAGEHVAVGAQFLLDSESRLRASSTPGGGHVH